MHVSDSIRPVGRGDVDGLKAVVDATGLFPSALLDGMLEAFLVGERPDEYWLTIDRDGHAAGIAYYAPERMTVGTWNLLLIAVDPGQQGRGLGQALMRNAEMTLAGEGQRVLLVETSGLPEFERTRGFYRQLGYTEEARIRDYYDAGEDKVVFWKSLAGRAQPTTAT